MNPELHISFCTEAIAEALKARGNSRPNPAVGAVIVKNKAVIGRGHTDLAGGPHAEIRAIADVKNPADLKGSELYVTLEPCCHQGKTPPCTDAIIRTGIAAVHAALRDPNPLVSGKPEKILSEKNIPLKLDFPDELKRKAFDLMLDFFWKCKTGRPFISIKAALSLDGRMAADSGDSQWISSEASREKTMELRRHHDAVMVGSGTAVSDNPRLTIRGGRAARLQPLRAAVDRDGLIPATHHLLADESPSVFVVGNGIPVEKRNIIESKKKILSLPLLKNRFDPVEMVNALGSSFELNSILIEGGASLHGSFLEAGIVDAFHIFVAPMIVGGKARHAAFAQSQTIEKLNEARRFEKSVWEKSGSDIYFHAFADPKKIEGLSESLSR
ncbi:MAG: bifunctional diaminohydroxyphosphoribosylaminopyrimidine deaminase/5-amino-6-(5-phosphoribosylamino)uracil reductase RibD [Spirochaetia bacterium]|nr:bifunctional diaminohydroxyphosphoribosylaminopyrimidine deaminase/5-amino-6-(5-phosphoribosylamino)uracil reductase RibD [Spirochaetia bacterium]